MESFWESVSAAHEEVLTAIGWYNFTRSVALVADQPSFLTSVYNFVDSVNWQEPFFRYLLAFHVTVAVVTMWWTYKGSPERIAATMGTLIVAALLTGPLNMFGQKYSASLFVLDDSHYFEESGLFISIVYWLPLAMQAAVMQVRLFIHLFRLMVKAKRLQLRARHRAAAAKPKAE